MNPGFSEFLRAAPRDRRDVFLGVGTRLGAPEQNVEKDFWVTWTLDVLFNGLPAGHPRFLFKGGTSLSKAYGLISRFSEDIDAVKVRAFEGVGPRFDFIIVDGRKAVLGLPAAAGEGVDISLVIDDPEVVRGFEQAFEDLWQSSKKLFNGLLGISPAAKLEIARRIPELNRPPAAR